MDQVGKVTIGVGRNLTDVGLSESEIHYLLENDVERAIEHALFMFPTFSSYPEDVQRVVVNVIFHLGVAGFNTFRRFISKIKSHSWDGAADELLNSKAARQTPERFKRHSDLLKSIGR